MASGGRASGSGCVCHVQGVVAGRVAGLASRRRAVTAVRGCGLAWKRPAAAERRRAPRRRGAFPRARSCRSAPAGTCTRRGRGARRTGAVELPSAGCERGTQRGDRAVGVGGTGDAGIASGAARGEGRDRSETCRQMQLEGGAGGVLLLAPSRTCAAPSRRAWPPRRAPRNREQDDGHERDRSKLRPTPRRTVISFGTAPFSRANCDG